ncbi:MAG: hypothetical protein IPM52_11975 [Bacteroidetes bacterium]|nr:hypothetical protein [Bacteroidota bacterium]
MTISSMRLLRAAISLLFILKLSISLPLLAQGPPSPPLDPVSGGGPVGGSAPVGSGIDLLLLMGAAYGSRKLYLAWQKKEE